MMEENPNNMADCFNCGSTEWQVFVTTIIDDARLYCIKCGAEWDGICKGDRDDNGEPLPIGINEDGNVVFE